MKHDMKFEVYTDGEFYCARCFDADIFTQGKTLDEVQQNIREATALYFEDHQEERDEYNGIMAMMEMSF